MEIALLIVAIVGVAAAPLSVFAMAQFNLKAMSILLDHLEEMHTVGGQPIDVVKTNLRIAETKASVEAEKSKAEIDKFSKNGKIHGYPVREFDIMSD
tara:strand:- start:852 stop:1142 length:291 start_codon:yes stop_codon:yes gene_type:complete